MSDIYIPSDRETTSVRWNSKLKEFHFNQGDRVDLRRVSGLKNLIFKTNPLPDLGESKRLCKVVNVYEKNVKCQFALGHNHEHKRYICYGIGDLVTMGLLTFDHGYPEAVRPKIKKSDWERWKDSFKKEEKEDERDLEDNLAVGSNN